MQAAEGTALRRGRRTRSCCLTTTTMKLMSSPSTRVRRTSKVGQLRNILEQRYLQCVLLISVCQDKRASFTNSLHNNLSKDTTVYSLTQFGYFSCSIHQDIWYFVSNNPEKCWKSLKVTSRKNCRWIICSSSLDSPAGHTTLITATGDRIRECGIDIT